MVLMDSSLCACSCGVAEPPNPITYFLGDFSNSFGIKFLFG
jgi:hypothetical protein